MEWSNSKKPQFPKSDHDINFNVIYYYTACAGQKLIKFWGRGLQPAGYKIV